MSAPCITCRELLAEGLDLCVRARDMDARDLRQASLNASSDPEGWVESGSFDRHVARHNIRHPESPISPRSASVRLWEQDQYEKDLAAWEARSRHHLRQGCDTPMPLNARGQEALDFVPIGLPESPYPEGTNR